jgi:hypothetical protein
MLGGTMVIVGGTTVAVGGIGVALAGMGVELGGIAVAVGGTSVLVGGRGVALGGRRVAVGGIDVIVGGNGVALGAMTGRDVAGSGDGTTATMVAGVGGMAVGVVLVDIILGIKTNAAPIPTSAKKPTTPNTRKSGFSRLTLGGCVGTSGLAPTTGGGGGVFMMSVMPASLLATFR